MTQGDLFKKEFFCAIIYNDGRKNKVINCHRLNEAWRIMRHVIKTEQNVAYVDICERTSNGPVLLTRNY